MARRSYSQQEKEAAIKLAQETTFAHASAQTGISAGTIKSWVARRLQKRQEMELQIKSAPLGVQLTPPPSQERRPQATPHNPHRPQATPTPEARQEAAAGDASPPREPTHAPQPVRRQVPAGNVSANPHGLPEELIALKETHQRFVLYFLGQAGGNATAAAEMAGLGTSYSTSARIAHDLRRRPDVRAAIHALMAQELMGGQEIRWRLMRHATASMEDLLDLRDPDAPKLDLATAERRGRLDCIKKLKIKTREHYTKDGDHDYTDTHVEVELHDPQAALDKLARLGGMYQDKLQLSGGVGVAVMQWTDQERQDAQQQGHARREGWRKALGGPRKPPAGQDAADAEVVDV